MISDRRFREMFAKMSHLSTNDLSNYFQKRVLETNEFLYLNFYNFTIPFFYVQIDQFAIRGEDGEILEVSAWTIRNPWNQKPATVIKAIPKKVRVNSINTIIIQNDFDKEHCPILVPKIIR